MFQKIIKILVPVVFILGLIIGLVLCFIIEGLNNNWYNFLVIPLGVGGILTFFVLGIYFVFRPRK